jgi:hypothetical protein
LLETAAIALVIGQASAQDRLAYRIAATLLPAEDRIVARAEVRLPAGLLDSSGAIRLDLRLETSRDKGRRQIVIDSVWSPRGERLALSALPESTEVQVRGVAEPGLPRAITVFFQVPLDVGYQAQLGYYLYTAVEPGDCWYPDIAGPAGQRERFRDFDVTLRFPQELTVLTSGAEATRGDSGGLVQVSYAAEHVEGFALAAGHHYVLQRIDGGDVPIMVFSDSAYAPTFRRVGTLAAEAVRWYERTYGFFPVRQLGIIQGYPRAGGGFPLPNVFMVHLRLLEPDFLSWITAHELGHYYWGLYVLGDEERLDWLMLANGIWADQLYMAERHRRSLAAQWRARGNGDWILDYLTAAAAGWEQRLGVPRKDEDDLHFDYNSLIRHGKGATGVYLAAARLGADRFLALQRRILAERRYRSLPEGEFTRLLDSAGVPEANAFFGAWRRGDARVDAVVDEVEPEARGYRVVIRRTGTVPYPIAVEIEDAEGRLRRDTLAADAQTDTIRLAERPRAVRLDPDGMVPMANSGHPGIRSLFVEAMDRADLVEPFLAAARPHLAQHPEDDGMRRALTRRLFWLGRYEEVVAAAERADCTTAEGCAAALTGARALARLGRRADAEVRLTALEIGARTVGAEAAWSRALEEARSRARP